MPKYVRSEVSVLSQEPLPFIISICIMCYSHPVILRRCNACCYICRRRWGWHVFLTCTNQDNVDFLVLMLSSNLVCQSALHFLHSCYQRCITALFPPKQDQLRFRIRLFHISPSPMWIFISFKLDANDTSRNCIAPGKSKTCKKLP